MRILYVAKAHDYGHASRGPSYDQQNFADALNHLGHQLIPFDYPTLAQQLPPRKLNRQLVELAEAEQPDLLFGVVRGGLLKPSSIKAVSALGVPTVNWFCDDHWQFDTETRRWAPAFDFVVTTARSALPRYARAGWGHVVLSQWAANPRLYPPPTPRSPRSPRSETVGPSADNHDYDHDITFVGQAYGQRPAFIQALRDAGLNVATFGKGWDHGPIDHDHMVRVFQRSRINLNFADASHPGHAPADRLRLHPVTRKLTQNLPGGWRLDRALLSHATRQRARLPIPRQIKGRVFEVPAAGGFLLTQPAEDLADYLTPGKELSLFDTPEQLVAKCRFYLEHSDQRQAIAAAGHRRVLAEHTWAHRFNALFTKLSLPTCTLTSALTTPRNTPVADRGPAPQPT
ncbi:MAG: glycosyltransferase [Planctomycetota bacterium]